MKTFEPPELDILNENADPCCTPRVIPALNRSVADRLAHILKALGHPVRVQIMYILATQGGRVCVCDIESQFNIKQPTISHHLRILREAGLVDAEQRGLYMYYRVTPDTLGFLKNHLQQLTP